MKWLRVDDYLWNGLLQPYHVLERHPDLAFIEPHLQVQCPLAKCRPTWLINYHNPYQRSTPPVNRLSTTPGERPLDWRKDAFAIHFNGGWLPPEFHDPQQLLRSNDRFAKIGRMVLEAADMVKHLQ